MPHNRDNDEMLGAWRIPTVFELRELCDHHLGPPKPRYDETVYANPKGFAKRQDEQRSQQESRRRQRNVALLKKMAREFDIATKAEFARMNREAFYVVDARLKEWQQD